MNELDFIVGLMRCNTHELGFIPSTRVAKYIDKGRYILMPRKGYLLHGKPQAFQPLVISQACVEYDLRSRGYGRLMVDELVERAKVAHASGIHLRCAENNEANNFWSAMGFERVRVLTPDNTRNRQINVWWMPLLPTLFTEFNGGSNGI